MPGCAVCHSESDRRRATLHQSESRQWNIRQCSYIYLWINAQKLSHSGGMDIHLPSGKLTLLLNMASYSELSHEKGDVP